MSINGVDHIVIRVKDFDEGIHTYRDQLGMTLEETRENEELGIKQAFFPFPGGGFLELVAPFGERSPVGDAIEKRGEGLHTISMAVEDLAATVAAMKDRGVRLIGEEGPQVFVHPASSHGVLLHLTEKK